MASSDVLCMMFRAPLKTLFGPYNLKALTLGLHVWSHSVCDTALCDTMIKGHADTHGFIQLIVINLHLCEDYF